uniref:Uncharacterized protein n=1 Tax=Aegilops tauschii TaxID=37682 RepID=M8BH33_AEGTA
MAMAIRPRPAAESGAGITLGCSCKGDLSYSHKQCAETWFKIRGNKETAAATGFPV